jgi:hypothetical protein
MATAARVISWSAVFAKASAVVGSAVRARDALDKAIRARRLGLMLNGERISAADFARYLEITEAGAIVRAGVWRNIPGFPAVLLHLVDDGDVRWAVSAVEFAALCEDLAADAAPPRDKAVADERIEPGLMHGSEWLQLEFQNNPIQPDEKEANYKERIWKKLRRTPNVRNVARKTVHTQYSLFKKK